MHSAYSLLKHVKVFMRTSSPNSSAVPRSNLQPRSSTLPSSMSSRLPAMTHACTELQRYVCPSSDKQTDWCKSGGLDLQGIGPPAAAPAALLLYSSHVMEERLQGCVALALIVVHEAHRAASYMRSLQDSSLSWGSLVCPKWDHAERGPWRQQAVDDKLGYNRVALWLDFVTGIFCWETVIPGDQHKVSPVGSLNCNRQGGLS